MSDPKANDVPVTEKHEANPKDGWNPELNQDEAIMAQERNIEREIAENIPFIGPKVNICVLKREYSNEDQVYQQKIQNLSNNYACIRKTRPDGNCFFRAFAYGYFESLLNDRDELTRFLKVAQNSKIELTNLGFSGFTIEDFHDTFLGLLKRIASKEITTPNKLAEAFNEPSISDYIVVYLRLVTSGHLQKNADFFSNFIEGGRTIKEFCSHDVEPMYKESDHIHIIALTAELKVDVRVTYLDRCEGGVVITHDFPEDQKSPRLRLLYRPGHYDILYKNDEISEN